MSLRLLLVSAAIVGSSPVRPKTITCCSQPLQYRSLTGAEESKDRFRDGPNLGTIRSVDACSVRARIDMCRECATAADPEHCFSGTAGRNAVARLQRLPWIAAEVLRTSGLRAGVGPGQRAIRTGFRNDRDVSWRVAERAGAGRL